MSCNGHFRELAEFVRRGEQEAGGFPPEFPVMSLRETLLRPTAMRLRNLASMDVDESIRGNPLHSVVPLLGCEQDDAIGSSTQAVIHVLAIAGRSGDEELDIDEHCVIVLKNCGPKGHTGMAEVGNVPLSLKVLRKGIPDMVRISDARMGGTAYGTAVRHGSPEAVARGG